MWHCLLHTSVLPRYLFRCDGSVLRIRRAETVEAGEYTNRSIREFVPIWAIPKETTWGHLNLGKKRGIHNFVFCLIRKMILIGRNLVFHIPMWLSQAPTSSCLGRSGGPFCCSSTKDIFSTVDFAAAQSMQHAQNGHSISGLLTS